MIEIRFHGRGGQGAVVASELLAQAAFLDGKEPQSFPFFGVERRGAPVTAYTRIDDRPIRLRTAIETPGVVVVLDPGLLRSTPVTEGMAAGGLLLVNTAADPASLPAPPTVRRAAVDATRIARAHGIGSATSPIVNTAVLGALAAATGIVGREALERAVDRFVPASRAANRAAVDDGFAAVRFAPPDAPAPAPMVPVPIALPPWPDGPVA
ncbi:pyruvate ferredoxin oxidoreductase, gamma subunit, partial [mine drainage metagenome]